MPRSLEDFDPSGRRLTRSVVVPGQAALQSQSCAPWLAFNPFLSHNARFCLLSFYLPEQLPCNTSGYPDPDAVCSFLLLPIQRCSAISTHPGATTAATVIFPCHRTASRHFSPSQNSFFVVFPCPDVTEQLLLICRSWSQIGFSH